MTQALRVLMIDDNPDDRALAARELGREWPGVEIVGVSTVEAFGQALEAGGFDVVVTDYHARFVDGVAVLRAVKERRPDCPVIMFTGTGSEEVAVSAMKAGLDDYVLKQHVVRLPVAVRFALERARERLAAREAETRYRDLFEGIPIGVFQSELGGRLRDVNPAWVQIMGFPDRETALAAHAFSHYVDPSDREGWMAMAARSQVLGYECQARRFDGKTIWIRITARAVADEAGRPAFFEGTIEDVAEQKRAEESLRAAEAKYRALVEQLPAVAYLLDVGAGVDDWRTPFVSPQAEALLGVSAGRLIENVEAWAEILYPDDADRAFSAVRRAVETGADYELEYRILRPDGGIVWVRDRAAAVRRDGTGRSVLYHGVLFDVTERKRAEEALRESNEQLLQAQPQSVVS